MNNFERKNIEKLKQGDLKTLEYIFHLYSLPLTRYAYRFVEDEGRARDMVQEVFYKLWRDRENLSVDISLEAFLYTCVKNECLNYLKHEKIKSRYAWLQKRIRDKEVQYYQETPEEDIRMEELRRKIHEAIESLPEKSRQIFKMSRFEEKKNKEIAREMDVSLKAVEKHITKALKHLRENLK
ncbi:MAG: RNA polymerase sigma-70 factor [Bacteroidales bacterium]|nr:RNA polymerase sigma-70 factor [Bacteroidales bacterium]